MDLVLLLLLSCDRLGYREKRLEEDDLAESSTIRGELDKLLALGFALLGYRYL